MGKFEVIFAVVASMTLAFGFTSAFGQEGEANFVNQADTEICHVIENGDRIRISVNSEHEQELSGHLEKEGTITGNLVSCDDGVLVIMTNYSGSSADSVRIRADQVDWLEVSQGRTSKARAGAGIGMITGMLVGISLQREGAQNEWMEVFPKEDYQNAVRVVGGALGGAVVGAIVGSFFSSEKWEKVFAGQSFNLQGKNSMGEYQVALGISF